MIEKQWYVSIKIKEISSSWKTVQVDITAICFFYMIIRDTLERNIEQFQNFYFITLSSESTFVIILLGQSYVLGPVVESLFFSSETFLLCEVSLNSKNFAKVLYRKVCKYSSHSLIHRWLWHLICVWVLNEQNLIAANFEESLWWRYYVTNAKLWIWQTFPGRYRR